MEFAPSDDESALIGAAERFGGERLRPAERAHEAARCYPPELARAYAEAGFASLTLPEDLGGSELPLGVAVLVWAKLAEADAGAPLGLGGVPPGVALLAPPCRELVLRKLPGALAIAEGRSEAPEARGRIPWIPAREVAWLLVCSRGGVLLVREPGVVLLEQRPLGLQAAGGVELSLDDAEAEVVGGPALARRVLAEGRAFAAALAVGAARDAVTYAMRYAQERVAFGRPIAHHQGLAFQLVDAATDVEAAALLLGAAAASEQTEPIAQAHAFVFDVALRVTERAVQALGGHGYLYDHPVEKRMRDVRALASLWGGASLSEAEAADRILEHPDALEGVP